MHLRRIPLLFCCFFTLFLFGVCKKSGSSNTPVTPVPTNEVDCWLTNGNQSVLLKKQSPLSFVSAPVTGYSTIEVDSATSYQSIDGFGYTLTGGSAYVINRLSAPAKSALLNELFGSSDNSIGISYLRISIGASDLSASVFSYNDLPAGQTDPTLSNFSLAADTVDLIPVLQQILAINPNIRILGSPWSPPVWMKDNGSAVGGSLLPVYYPAYANYFVKYIRQMQLKGIPVDAVTIQNEPENGGNTPSMLMTATQQADFIKNHLGPAFQLAGISTKIILWDHNCDHPNYPISILNDATAKAFVDGSAFHLYSGDISALSAVRAAHPDKNLYFTEQWTGANGTFDGDIKWHLENVIIGSMRNWSRNALEWNLATDASYGPHTTVGCTECKGALTIIGSSVTRNVSYYIVAHASKFVPAGSVRIASNVEANLPNVAFKTPSGKKVIIVLNKSNGAQGFNVRYKGKWFFASLPAGSVGTYTW